MDKRDKLGRFAKGRKTTAWNKGKRAYEFDCLCCGQNNKTSDKRNKFCNHSCSTKYMHQHNRFDLTNFHKAGTKSRIGLKPWNYLDGRSKTPVLRKTVKGKQIAHVVYCFQPENLSYVPKGFVIHHIDTNPHNNNPNNLFLMVDRDHRVLHNAIYKALLGRHPL